MSAFSVRDAPFGQLCRLVLGPRVFLYPDEEAGFQYQLPEETQVELPTPPANSSSTDTDADVEKAEPVPSPGQSKSGYQTVSWYSETDPENPQTWSLAKKTVAFSQICLLTFSVYCGSAIITPAQPTFVEMFGVSVQESSLALSMYVLGYGVGPLFFSPLSEIPAVGRNIPYFVSFTLFIVITAVTSRVSNFAGLIVLRFLQGLLGGPVLATGGASAADILSFPKIPYGLTFWGCATLAGPALGPLLSGFSVPLSSWRWSMYELLILCGFTWILLFFFLPETNGDFILLNRTKRLRKSTGNENLRSDSEIKQGNIHFLSLLGGYLTTPFLVTLKDPSIAFINVYTGLIYGIFYSFFESFPIVYTQIHGFSMGIMGIIFLCVVVACFFGAGSYLALVKFHYEPYTYQNGIGSPEHRLLPAVFAALIAPFGILIFAWTSRDWINWVVPTIGIVLYMSCVFVITMCIFIYLPISYPRYAASLFAANSFLRSAVACAAIHFSQPLFINLGIGKGCSVLAGLTWACFFGILALWEYGDKLRARSTFAQVY
ncbi:Major facilitator superfamily domain, general substrate transporter [Penicillium griseofulvum]|uniref:Major facilitator superfamily domain, general substrate transporter n=1 Tax=Penicillium patulum TaxID=5078 RepID=A0A135LMQ7_PENPA|nr:Major facilitator superfamily domain, general substrate transporter [Penicillium griseofulvum]KXG50247.1 Major facilitator superfamily domain, general substrate transporter [Penicillium griseofulvum]